MIWPVCVDFTHTTKAGRELSVSFGSQSYKTYWCEIYDLENDLIPITNEEECEVVDVVEGELAPGYGGLADDVRRVGRI